MTEQQAQALLDQRGYLVVSSFYEMRIGDVTDNVDWSETADGTDKRGVTVVVIAKTDRADFIEQHKISGTKCWLNSDETPNYYRVTAE